MSPQHNSEQHPQPPADPADHACVLECRGSASAAREAEAGWAAGGGARRGCATQYHSTRKQHQALSARRR